jgi:23S rRNA (cytosine1962-C5)-methyltransferase
MTTDLAQGLDGLWPAWQPEWLRHQDAELVAIDKPADVASQPDDAGHGDDACSRLVRWLGERDAAPAAALGMVQRLDRLASGLVIYGRSKRANRSLGAELARGVPRVYLCGVESLGRLARRGTAERLAHRVVGRRGSRLLVEIETAERRPRIRERLAELGAPIAGDRANGGPLAWRLMLHLGAIEVSHPATGERLRLSSPPPASLGAWLHTADVLPSDSLALEIALRDAAARRYAIAHEQGTNALRLCNAQGDGLPGVTVDRYGDWLVASLVEPATPHREHVLDALARLGPRGIYLKLPPRTSSRLGDARRAELAPPGPVRGEAAPDPLEVRESGLPFEVSLGDGLSTGLFLDQRANRGLVRTLGRARRVLNLFAYTGSFTVAAIAGGASATTTVDVSRKALDRAARNIALLGKHGGEHRLEQADAQRWLERCARGRERFDLVVLDPPSFATTKRSRFAAADDYGRLAAACLRCLDRGGRLLACTNHRGIGRDRLAHELGQAAAELGLRVHGLEHLPEPVDFPPPPGEECHLKAVLLELG